MLSDIGSKADHTALNIVRRLHKAGHRAVFVGGCVRDSLLGKQPKDWDIATSAMPEDIERLFAHTIPVGKSFGVMIVHQDGRDFEVATFRQEDTYRDGRRPDKVTYAGEREDAERRDFTINALMYDPATDEILDFVGGRDDLERGVLRTVGKPVARFSEDHLRLLRAVRFAARVGFDLHPDTLAAMRSHAGLVVTVSPERIGEELRRMYSEGAAEKAFCLLDQSNLMLHVLPEIARMRGVPQPEAFHPEGDVMTHTRLMCGILDESIRHSLATAQEGADEKTGCSQAPRLQETEDGERRVVFPSDLSHEIIAWVVLLHDVGKPSTIKFAERIRFDLHDRVGAEKAQEILTRLRRPNKVVQPVCEVIARHMRFPAIRDMREAKRRRWLNDPLFPYDLELHRIDSAGSHQKEDTYAFALDAWEAERKREPEPTPLLTGKDLIAMGYRPGPNMGRILAAVEDARLEHRIRTPEEARAWVQAYFPPDRQEQEQ